MKSNSLQRSPTVTHILVCFFFLTNIVEYLVLVLDWSHTSLVSSPPMCALYQFLTQFTSLLPTITIVLMVYFIYNGSGSQNIYLRSSIIILVMIIISALLSLLGNHLLTYI